MKHLLSMAQRWLYGVFLGVDMTACAFAGGAPMETFSARFYQNRSSWGARPMRWTDAVARVVFGVANHCGDAWVAYQARIKAAPVWSG